MSPMGLVWSSIALLCAAVALAFLRLRSGGSAEMATPARVDVEIYREQLRNVQVDLERGLLTAPEARALEADISRRLIRAADQDRPGSDGSAEARTTLERYGHHAAIGLAIAGAVALYASIGNPQLPGQPYVARDFAGQMDVGLAETRLDEIAATLDAGAAPAEAWRTLGNRYLALRRFAKAEAAFRTAIERGPESVALWNSVGTSVVFQGQGSVTQGAAEAFRQALRLDPENPMALYFLGVQALESANESLAKDYFQRSLNRTGQDDPWAQDLRNRLKALDEARAGDQSPRLQPGPTDP